MAKTPFGVCHHDVFLHILWNKLISFELQSGADPEISEGGGQNF